VPEQGTGDGSRAAMTLLELLGVLVLAAAGWLLWGNLKAREIANAAISAACKAEGLLFLNDTVGLDSIWPKRNEEGHVIIRRIYGFEYSDTGHNRRKGTVTLLGDTVTGVYVGPRPVEDGETWH
jgi:hypothetical protein